VLDPLIVIAMFRLVSDFLATYSLMLGWHGALRTELIELDELLKGCRTLLLGVLLSMINALTICLSGYGLLLVVQPIVESCSRNAKELYSTPFLLLLHGKAIGLLCAVLLQPFHFDVAHVRRDVIRPS